MKKKYLSTCPQVSIVIAAKNEESKIKKRLENICAQSYSGPLEIVIVSDGSNDKTCNIIKQFRDALIEGKEKPVRGSIKIKLIELFSPQGKATALNKGISSSSCEIIVFADSRQTFNNDAIKELMANFSDSQVGAVSGELIIQNTNNSEISEGMGCYWSYEKFIRKRESLTGSVVGATGAIYAIRKHLYRKLPVDTLLDDVLTPLNISLQGYRVIFDSKAIAFDTTSPNIKKEWSRKVRTLGGNWQLLSINPCFLLPGENLIFFRFLSHKIFRLLVPYALLIIFINSFIIDNQFYNFFAFIQLMFYLLATLAFLIPSLQKCKIIKFIYFFVTLNLAAVAGFINWITKQNNASWKR